MIVRVKDVRAAGRPPRGISALKSFLGELSGASQLALGLRESPERNFLRRAPSDPRQPEDLGSDFLYKCLLMAQ